MSSRAFYWLTALGLFLLTLASVGAKALYEIAWHDLKDYCLSRDRRQLFDEIHDSHDNVQLAMESLRTVATLIILIGTVGWFAMSFPNQPVSIWLILDAFKYLLFAILVGGVWLPFVISDGWEPKVLFRMWRVFKALALTVVPVSYCGRVIKMAFHRMNAVEEESEEEAFEDEVLAIVTEGMHDGHLEADAREMIEGVMDLADADVADIMTPRSKMEALPVEWEWRQVLDFVTDCGRTRIPVYDGRLDNVVGILYVKDLLSELSQNEGRPRTSLRELLRKPWYVPPTQNLDELLQDFRQTRNHLAIVRDEFSRVAGLVTIEDVLEEIVGEIVDETDPEHVEEIRRVNATTAVIQGRAHLAEVNEALGLNLPEPEVFDTIAGYVVNHLGRIPSAGEQINSDSVIITILQASKRKVEQVKLEALVE